MIPAQKQKEKNTLMLRALSGEATARTPLWLMRQAGRYLPEYREVREKAGSFLDLCFNPGLAAEATLQPLRRFDLDAAIIFSDILVIPFALGQEVSFAEGEGPRLGPLADPDFSAFAERLAPVYEALRLVKRGLAPEKTLMGFAGAPFTLACYMIEGAGGGRFEKAAVMAKNDASALEKLTDALTEAVSLHLLQQIGAGADAVQLFDSWAGLLDEESFHKFVITPARKIVSRIHGAFPGFPVIGFPRGAGRLYPVYAEKTGVDCISIDQHTTMEWAADSVPEKVCLQGNLDPEALLEGGEVLETETLRVLQAAAGRPFVFNLGHGVLKDTPPDHVETLVTIVRGFERE